MCLRRRFFKSPIETVAAGEKGRVLFHIGRICIKQLTLRYNANDTTGSNKNKWLIKVDGQEILNMSLKDIYVNLCGYAAAPNSDRPVIMFAYSESGNIYTVIFHDLGRVEESIEVWLENVDTSNLCYVSAGMVYDVLE